jgi:hypothetical protein
MKRILTTAAVVALAISPAFAKNDAMSLIPTDAVTVGVMHVADMRTSPLSSTLFRNTDTVTTRGEADHFLTDAGLDIKKDIDVLVVSTAPVTALGSEAKVLVAADGRFNVERLTNALVARGAVKKTSANGAYLLLPESKTGSDHGNGAVAFPDSRLALVGSEAAVVKALADRAAGGTSFASASGLGREMGRIDAHATAWALVDVVRAKRLGNGINHGGNHADFSAALKNVSTLAVWATDAGDSLKLGAFGLSHDAETLQLVEDTVRGALSAMRLAAQDKSPDLVSVLRRFNISRGDDSVTVSGTVPAETLKTFAATQHHTATR